MKLVVLGLGSNRGFEGDDSVSLLKKACILLKNVLSDLRTSSVYRTRPMYVENQDDFYNMVVCGYAEDDLSPFELLKTIHVYESSLGRDRSREIRNGPRSIDIDIEFFGEETINESDLQIPHPRISERPFVLIPLLEILKKSADIQMNKDFSKIVTDSFLSDVESIISADDFWK